ncbi:hypothetical protein V499_06139, partial [Pseudogymnoascus sp. VKM F-103]
LAPAMTRVGGDSGFVMEKGDGEAEKRDNALGEQGFRRENRVQGAEHGCMGVVWDSLGGVDTETEDRSQVESPPQRAPFLCSGQWSRSVVAMGDIEHIKHVEDTIDGPMAV